MPSIGDMEYGFAVSGVDTYLDDIHNGALKKTAEAINNTTPIKTACDAEWEGHAKDVFKNNLDKTAKHVADQMEILYSILRNEVHEAAAAMKSKDETMIDAQ